MKKKISYILLIGILCFLHVNNVFAAEFSVSTVVDNTTVSKGNIASIKINVKSSELVDSCMFKYEADSGIEFDSMSSLNGWTIGSNGVNGILIGNEASSNTLANGQNVLQLKFKVNNSGKVIIKTSQCVTRVDEAEYTYGDQTINFVSKDLTGNTTLSSLNVTGGAMDPSSIVSGTTDYTINLNSTTFGLSMTASNPDYQDDIVVKDASGKVIKDLSKITFSDSSGQGMMNLTVTVNNTTTYKLLVLYRKKEYDNSLKKVTIDGKELALVPGKYDYTYVVGKDVTSVKVDAILSDGENFKFGSDSNGPGTFNFTDMTHVNIVVVPKNSSSGATSAVYVIEIRREGYSNNEKPGGSSSSSSGGAGNINTNPTTGDIPMILMGIILIISLTGSVLLYQKNLQGYK